VDILLLVMPMLEPDAPTAGVGVIKAHLKANGFHAEVFDVNIDLFQELQSRGNHSYHYFTGEGAMKFSNNLGHELNQEMIDFYDDHKYIFDKWLKLIGEKNPKWVGMSLLSPFSAASSMLLSRLIKEEYPHIKIVWGGTNIQHGGLFRHIHEGTIDYFIKGDGERAIIELLNGNTDFPGINKIDVIDQIEPLDDSLTPDYEDIDWSKYKGNWARNVAFVSASRGCVRKCTFCNDFQLWPKYRFKSAKKVAEQVRELCNKYGRETIHFTDSLLNGSPPVFAELMKELADIRKEQLAKGKKFGWESHIIFRPKSQQPEEVYRLMAESGCDDAVMGLESFSESVRWHMRKKFTNEDVWYTFEMLHKYKIHVQCLMLIGYATETEEDHQENLRGIDRAYELGYANAKSDTGRPLWRWTFGNSLLLNDKHILFDILREEDPHAFEHKTAMDWRYRDNDMATRLRRWKESIAQVQKWDPSYQPSPTTLRTIEITEERLKTPDGPRFWSE
jgi:anaerobic magnesium-protoporphyrin IX monomethyl ester cyclase